MPARVNILQAKALVYGKMPALREHTEAVSAEIEE